MSHVKFIYASNPQGVIGYKNKLPWNLREDLLLFKEKTLHQTVMMGSRTYESLPDTLKPIIPNRTTVIVSSQGERYRKVGKVIQKPLEYVLTSKEPVWVIGGANLFEQLKSACIEVHHTEVHLDVEGDTFFSMDLKDWSIASDSGLLTSKSKIDYTVTVYRKPL